MGKLIASMSRELTNAFNILAVLFVLFFIYWLEFEAVTEIGIL